MANIFNKIFNNFSDPNKNSVLGIDIGASSLKVVQLKLKKGKAVLQTYGEIALGPYAGLQIGRATKLPAEKVNEALQDLLHELKITTFDSAISIPMQSSMVSVFRMPDLKEKQLAQMVPIEARKYVPVPIAEVSLDWFVIPELANEEYIGNDNKKFVEVMVVAIHNDVLNDFNNVVSLSKLQTSFFEVEMFSASRSILESGYLTPVMIVDIGAGATKVYITERGIIRDSNIINRGSQDITLNISKAMNIDIDFAEKLKRNFGKNDSAQDVKIAEIVDLIINPILNDVNRILLNFQKIHNKNITKIFLTGGGSLLRGLQEKTEMRLAIETKLGKPFDKVETPAFLEPILTQVGATFSGAVGLALRKLQELE
jgi:type IV pilus assembly protein PilM